MDLSVETLKARLARLRAEGVPVARARLATLKEALIQAATELTHTSTVPMLESIRRERIKGLAVIAALFVGFGGWAATSDLTGAVIAPGVVVIESDVKKIQHPTGGVVGEIRVRDGMSVKAGDLIVSLDETVDQANRALLVRQIDEGEGRLARLEAERDGATTITFPASLLSRRSDPYIAHILSGEVTLFDSRVTARSGKKAQFRERITQLGEEITGFEGQSAAKRRELSYIAMEKKGVEELVAKKLTPITRLNALQRDEARLVGETDQLRAGVAQARGKIAETELQILQLDQDTRTDVLKELLELQGKLGELRERRVAAEDRLRRVEIRAPIAGVVHEMTAHTVGGVVGGGEVIAKIVPVSEALSIEARVPPHDIDQVSIGQSAFVRMSAFNQRTTPEIEGKVSRVGANLSQEREGGAQFYTIRVAIPEDQLQRLGALRLVPGMPAEVHLRTEARSALSYLLKPLVDSMARAGREK